MLKFKCGMKFKILNQACFLHFSWKKCVKSEHLCKMHRGLNLTCSSELSMKKSLITLETVLMKDLVFILMEK